MRTRNVESNCGNCPYGRSDSNFPHLGDNLFCTKTAEIASTKTYYPSAFVCGDHPQFWEEAEPEGKSYFIPVPQSVRDRNP